MTFISINPATEERLAEYALWSEHELEQALAQTVSVAPAWHSSTIARRGELLQRVAAELRHKLDRYAVLITSEMGKPIHEAREEVEKCAWGCEFFAEHAERFLRDEPVETDASKSYVSYAPMGTVLAIMPWNFPFWQTFRFAAPALMAGNCALLKHASNVPQCAEAIEQVFLSAGFPPGVFQWLRISTEQTEKVIVDPRIDAVTLTGSEQAGLRVAALAGSSLKKTVLELGGSDPFVVLADADLEQAASVAVTARFQNGGQSCIAAKRFILVASIADQFLALFKAKVGAIRIGDPLREDTRLGPMARLDLREQLHLQVSQSIRQGAKIICGCEPIDRRGYFYQPSILDDVRPGMSIFDEEVFGPVAAVIRVRDQAEALAMANNHRYGLGASVWTSNTANGELFARHLQSGLVFINGLVKSDPRLPFGGVKNSGYGRELGQAGIREFVNIKSVWVTESV